jgi:hypothetical protein
VRAAADELNGKLVEVEENLVQLKLTGRGQDNWRFAPKLAQKIEELAKIPCRTAPMRSRLSRCHLFSGRFQSRARKHAVSSNSVSPSIDYLEAEVESAISIRPRRRSRSTMN